MVAFLVACGHDSPTTPPPPRLPAAIVRAGGDSASGVVATVLPAFLRVRVTSRDGAGVAAVAVAWSADVGGVTGGTTASDADGYATSAWRLGTLAGVQHAHATVAGLGTVEFTATAGPGAIALLRLDRSLAMLRSGDALQFGLSRAEDAFANAIPTAGLAIAWSSDAPAVADVSPNGLLSAHTRGEAMVIAAAGDARDTAYVKVDEIAWTAVSVGRYHSCALAADGRIFCWGQNAYGELGDGTTTARSYPAVVAGSVSYSAISANTYHSCALGSAGEAYCWGDNPNGMRAPTAADRYYVPTPVALGFRFVRIGAGLFSNCGLTASGAAYCWGTRLDGVLGDGLADGSYTATPSRVLGGPYLSLSVGATSSCGVGADSVAYCWGDAPVATASGYASVPQRIAGSGRLTQVSVGNSHACSLSASGDASCWGYNFYGEIGDGTTDPRALPALALSGAAEVSAGQFYSCARTLAGTVMCWGALGSSFFTPDPSRIFYRPVPIAVPEAVSQLEANDYGWHSCAVTRRGNVYCWGSNVFGQLGDGSSTTHDAPARIVEPR